MAGNQERLAIIDPLEEAKSMAGWFPDYLFEVIDTPAELPRFTKARLRRHFGDDIEEGLRLVCDELPMLPAETQADVAAYICGYPKADLEALLYGEAIEIVQLLDERFPPVAQNVIQFPGNRTPINPTLNTAPDSEYLAWQNDALCAQTDPEAFFPEKGGSTRSAKAICGGCDVAEQCLTYALQSDERFGIWGAHSERERRKISKDLIKRYGMTPEEAAAAALSRRVRKPQGATPTESTVSAAEQTA